MSRIIINNESTHNDLDALEMVGQVVAGGRVSDGGYCYATIFSGLTASPKACVYATKNAKSDSFRITDYSKAH